jgi:hypothetical protein
LMTSLICCSPLTIFTLVSASKLIVPHEERDLEL